MKFNIKKFSKTNSFVVITLIASILWIIGFFFLGNWDNTEFNSSNVDWYINNINWNNNGTIINSVETWWEVQVVDKIINYYWETKDPEYLNIRNELTSTLYWIDLIKAYFEIWNRWFYKDACSLLKRDKCNASVGNNLNSFSKFWTKLDWGYNILDIYKSNKQPNNWEIVFCVKYEYKLKQDMSIDKIQETFQYRVLQREDWLDEITSRVCEEKSKWSRILKCPIITSNLYCS